MTLLSRRKRRTTVRRTTPATLAVKFAALAALVATPAFAQPPGYTPPQPGAQQPGMLPLPPGYRPRTAPPQAQPPGKPAAAPGASAAMPSRVGTGGRILYFQKPADALAVTGAEDDVGSAPAAPRDPVVPAPVPDVAAPALLPPPPSRYLPPDPPPAAPIAMPPAAPVTVSDAAPVAYQPPDPVVPKPGDPVVVQKKDYKIPPVDQKFIQLPPRDHIFMVYNDLELEKAITQRVRQDLVEQKKVVEEKYLVFPALPVVSPPGVAYQPKTLAYAPSRLLIEPAYVVHRRLHFEEKNSERYGWDLGPLSMVVSAGYFYRDALLWPQSLASGCVTGFWSTSAGKCMPGAPVPYYLYPVGLTVTGTAAETLAITTAAFIFP